MNLDLDLLWEEVKENHKKLNSCNFHEFEDITPEKKLDKKYRCKNCGGELFQTQVSYYNLGLKHGKEAKK